MKNNPSAGTRGKNNTAAVPELNLVIGNEIVKQLLEFVEVKTNDLREEFNDKIKSRDAEISKLHSENLELRYQLDAASQYNRRDNLKIIGVKYDENENINQIVKDLAAHVGVPLDDKDISVAHRILTSDDKEDTTETTANGKPKHIPSIIVKLVQETSRQNYLMHVKRIRTDQIALTLMLLYMRM